MAHAHPKPTSGPVVQYPDFMKAPTEVRNHYYTPDMSAPSSGQFEIIPAVIGQTGEIDSAPTGGNKNTYSGISSQLSLAYGLKSSLSVFIETIDVNNKKTTETTPETQTKTSGLGDGIIGFKGVIERRSHFVYYNANYRTALQSNLLTDSGYGTQTPGSVRPSFNFYLGGGLYTRDLAVAAQVGYNHYQDGKSETQIFGIPSSKTDYGSGDGYEWKVYLQTPESQWASWRLGTAYSQTVYNDFESSVSGVKSNTSYNTLQSLYLYSLVELSDFSELLLQAEAPSAQSGGARYSLYNISAQLRFIF